MIDKITMYSVIDLDVEKFNRNLFKIVEFDREIENELGQMTKIKDYIYAYNFKGVDILYFPKTYNLRVRGRLINISEKHGNKVSTLDSLYADNSLDKTIDIFNAKIKELTGALLDIRNFTVSYIEVTFNINTPYVDDYVNIFNVSFQNNQKSGKYRRYKNFAIEYNKEFYTSFYIKTLSDFEKYNTNGKKTTNYSVNFYNKLDQLNYLLHQNEGKQEYERANISEEDLILAKDKLRLEVQCSYTYLESICNRYGITRTLGSFLDIDLCSNIIKEKYGFFIDGYLYNNFYSYHNAKAIIESAKLKAKERKSLLDFIEAIVKGWVNKKYRSYSTRKRYLDKLAKLNIHPLFLKGSIDTLVSPMELLDNHIKYCKERKETSMDKDLIFKKLGIMQVKKAKKAYYVTDALHETLKEQSEKENIGISDLTKELLNDYVHYIAPIVNDAENDLNRNELSSVIYDIVSKLHRCNQLDKLYDFKKEVDSIYDKYINQ